MAIRELTLARPRRSVSSKAQRFHSTHPPRFRHILVAHRSQRGSKRRDPNARHFYRQSPHPPGSTHKRSQGEAGCIGSWRFSEKPVNSLGGLGNRNPKPAFIGALLPGPALLESLPRRALSSPVQQACSRAMNAHAPTFHTWASILFRGMAFRHVQIRARFKAAPRSSRWVGLSL